MTERHEQQRPRDPNVMRFGHLATRAAAARDDLLERLVDPAVILDREPMYRALAKEVVGSLPASDWARWKALPSVKPLSHQGAQRQDRTEGAINGLTTASIGTLDGFRLSLVEEERALFAKTIGYKGVMFTNVIHMCVRDDQLRSSSHLLPECDDPARVEFPQAEELHTGQALERIRLYTEFMENLSELPVDRIRYLLQPHLNHHS